MDTILHVSFVLQPKARTSKKRRRLFWMHAHGITDADVRRLHIPMTLHVCYEDPQWNFRPHRWPKRIPVSVQMQRSHMCVHRNAQTVDPLNKDVAVRQQRQTERTKLALNALEPPQQHCPTVAVRSLVRASVASA